MVVTVRGSRQDLLGWGAHKLLTLSGWLELVALPLSQLHNFRYLLRPGVLYCCSDQGSVPKATRTH
jgi:hypothetical protein